MAALPFPDSKRWVIACMGTLLQVCLGTVYAWSYFQKPMLSAFQCSQSQAAWAFSLAICFLGLSAAWGGANLARLGPRRLALSGGVLYAGGSFLAALAISLKSLPLLYAGFGVVGGIGLGLGYVTPVATAAKWFPDKKGLVTGMVVMGFGLGALVMSKVIAPLLMARFGGNLVTVFCWIGFILLVGTLLTGWFMENPPKDPGRSRRKEAHSSLAEESQSLLTSAPTRSAPSGGGTPGAESYGLGDCLRSGHFVRLWVVFFCNITAGIMFIGFQSPMLQELLKADGARSWTVETLAAAGATLIGVSSLCNGLGRIFWGGISDRLGRATTFRLILGSQTVVFVGLIFVHNPWWFGAWVCYVLLCYGGGFGTMPSFVLDSFGAQRMPVVYGAMLTAWSLGGIAGPQIAAMIKDRFPQQASLYTFATAAVLLGAGFGLACFLKDELTPLPPGISEGRPGRPARSAC